MKSLWKRLVQIALVIGLGACLTDFLVAQDAEQAGIVRISKPKTSDSTSGQVMPVVATQIQVGSNATPGAPSAPASAACDSSPSGLVSGSMGIGNGNCRRGYRKYYRQDWRYSDWQGDDCWGSGLHRRTHAQSVALENCFFRAKGHSPSIYYHDPSGQDMLNYFQCKFGYFCPSGGGGVGIPWVGHYSRVYPVNPYYSDSRDGQTWAAQGYGIPVAVPLAPVVGHTYDYGWGVPSSRLTPISHPAY